MCLTISYSTIPKLSFVFSYRYTHQRLAIVSFSHSLNITSLFSKNTCYHYNAFRKYQPSTTTKFSFHTPLNLLSLSLWLGCWPVEDLFHSTSLGHVGLEILGGVCYPGRVKLGGVLVHQVGVFGAPRSSKVLDLHDFGKNCLIEMILKCRWWEVLFVHIVFIVLHKEGTSVIIFL